MIFYIWTLSLPTDLSLLFSPLYTLWPYKYYIVRGPQYSHRIQSWSWAVTCALRQLTIQMMIWPKMTARGRWYAPKCVTPGVTARGHSISISISRHQSASTKILSFWLSALPPVQNYFLDSIAVCNTFKVKSEIKYFYLKLIFWEKKVR